MTRFNSLPIAYAVNGWSPVTIITFIPAWWHSLIDSFTSSLTGSIKPTIPRNLRFLMSSSLVLFTSPSHTAMTRYPDFERVVFCSSYNLTFSENDITFSNDPFTVQYNLPFFS